MSAARIPRVLTAVLAIAALASCSRSGTSASAESVARDSLHSDSAGGLVVAPREPYVTAAGGPAALVINVARDSSAPVAQVGEGACEVEAAKPESTSDAVYWIDGLRQGKPLPNDRRYQLISAGCALTPRIQAVVIGGTVNVFNDDVVSHRLVFIRAGTDDTLQTMPFTNGGEIVATERLTKTPGVIEVRCAQHPQERAYIAVFDHPYFGVATAGEHITLDSLPPGDYQIVTWREGMPAPSSVATKVGANGQTQVIVR